MYRTYANVTASIHYTICTIIKPISTTALLFFSLFSFLFVKNKKKEVHHRTSSRPCDWPKSPAREFAEISRGSYVSVCKI